MQYKDTPTAPGFCSAWLRGLGFHLRTWAVLLWACCLCAGVDAQTVQTGAVPTLVFGSGDHRVDLRGMWEGGVIEAAPDANTPDALWAMDAKRFGRGAGEALLSLKPGQRFVARLRIQTNSTADALYLEIPMARLDRVQVSYRSALGAWSTWVAGDRVAMQDWPVLGTYPRFVLPANGGALDVVIEVAHKGAFRMPAYVSSSQSFLRASMSEQLGAGGLLGLGLTIALLGFLMGNTFHRWGFVVIAIMTLGFSAGIATNSGLAGAYLFTQSQVFNDIAKFATSLFRCCPTPSAACWTTGFARDASGGQASCGLHSQCWCWQCSPGNLIGSAGFDFRCWLLRCWCQLPLASVWRRGRCLWRKPMRSGCCWAPRS
jgi:7TMR-DISM extracellular 2